MQLETASKACIQLSEFELEGGDMFTRRRSCCEPIKASVRRPLRHSGVDDRHYDQARFVPRATIITMQRHL